MPNPDPDLEALAGRILTTYLQLAPEPGQPVPLAELRRALSDIPRRRLDEVLTAIAERPAVHLAPKEKGDRLSREDREVVLRLHGQDMHVLTIGEPRQWWETAPGEPKDENLAGARPVAPARVLDACRQLGHGPGDYFPLADLRRTLRGVRGVDLNATLIDMYRRQEINLIPREFRHRLTPADELAALRVGGEYKHLIAITP